MLPTLLPTGTTNSEVKKNRIEEHAFTLASICGNRTNAKRCLHGAATANVETKANQTLHEGNKQLSYKSHSDANKEATEKTGIVVETQHYGPRSHNINASAKDNTQNGPEEG